MKKHLIFPLILLTACQAPQLSNRPGGPVTVQRSSVSSRGLVKATYAYSADKTELTLTMVQDTGETIESRTVRNPVGGNSVQATTTIKRNGAVVSTKPTVSEEAQLAIKVVANNGWADVYKELKTRYQLAGLVS